MKHVMVLFAFIMIFGHQAYALEIGGTEIAEQVSQADGKELVLNGAGIRSKVFFKIYIAALYLENKTDNADNILQDSGGKRMLMHFLYDEVGKDQLVEAWDEGFSGNGSDAQLAELNAEIEAFNNMFETVKKGDQIILDYMPETGTTVIIRGEQKGVIKGKPFSDLLFSIWLGAKPVTTKLKNQLLGK